MSVDNKLLYQIALTQVTGVGDITARNLLRIIGDEEQIFKQSKKALNAIQGLPAKTVDEIHNTAVMRKAEKELAFVQKNNLSTYFITHPNYPHRMCDCYDAPILLYYKGVAEFNVRKVVSIVGTRHSSNYGTSFCDTFLEELAQKAPNTLVISGLAYGIDIHAHRAALTHSLPTIGVLAHGLDRIYPATHRQTAAQMCEQGGLLTEFVSETQPDKFNFVRRNRIVAGMADAVLVIESNAKGGSLITADIAASYCRSVFALPGRVGDMRSAGCNNLIADHKADILLSCDHFLKEMGWDADSEQTRKKPKQQQLFVELTEDEQKIIDTLQAGNLHVDALACTSNIPTYLLFTVLLDLEMKNLIQCLPGSVYAVI